MKRAIDKDKFHFQIEQAMAGETEFKKVMESTYTKQQ